MKKSISPAVVVISIIIVIVIVAAIGFATMKPKATTDVPADPQQGMQQMQEQMKAQEGKNPMAPHESTSE